MTSGTCVGAPGAPEKWLPGALGRGIAPEAKKSAAFGSINDVGIVLLGKGAPGVRPAAANLAFWAGSAVLGTVMGVLKTPLRSDCGMAGANTSVPATNLRHSWFQKKNVFLRSLLYSFGIHTGPPRFHP